MENHGFLYTAGAWSVRGGAKSKGGGSRQSACAKGDEAIKIRDFHFSTEIMDFVCVRTASAWSVVEVRSKGNETEHMYQGVRGYQDQRFTLLNGDHGLYVCTVIAWNVA
jgi:hypothetical protein